MGLSRTISVRLDDETVTVERGQEYRRQYRDLIAVARDSKGRTYVVAVGSEPKLWATASNAAVRTLQPPEVSTALSTNQFVSERADAFLRYVLFEESMTLGIPRLIKPALCLHLPGYEVLPLREREAFEWRVSQYGHPTTINGSKASAPQWKWPNVLAELARFSLVIAPVVAVRFYARQVSPQHRFLVIVAGLTAALLVALLMPRRTT